MGDLLVRNVPKRTLDSLRVMAKRHQRSVQAEVLEILEGARVPAGDALIDWISRVRKPGLLAQPGLQAIRRARDER